MSAKRYRSLLLKHGFGISVHNDGAVCAALEASKDPSVRCAIKYGYFTSRREVSWTPGFVIDHLVVLPPDKSLLVSARATLKDLSGGIERVDRCAEAAHMIARALGLPDAEADEDLLPMALTSTQGDYEKWEVVLKAGPHEDSCVLACVGKALGSYGGHSGGEVAYDYHGGDNPRIVVKTRGYSDRTEFKGKKLVAAVRRVFGIETGKCRHKGKQRRKP